MFINNNASVTILGAGPGDPELITLKGVNALKSANVVLYDALSNNKLLDFAPDNAIKIFVGKRAAKHIKTQDEINALIVHHALKHGHVVRLKGGDPFVFGRGHEEKVYVEKHNINVQIIPGISSCISVPELQEIPLTRRGISQSFWVMTATNKAGSLCKDIEIAATSSATLVILMGMRKLHEIVGIFSDIGKSETPVMIVQNGSLPEEKSVVGKISNIQQLAEEACLGTPAIIVIGEVVTLHPAATKKELIRLAS
ncbi:UNVERIFIED_CONTAM: hypothetical protein GTU68_053657 [Idotea baltica]|nr:hypothetical protein [Idotea baltica]